MLIISLFVTPKVRGYIGIILQVFLGELLRCSISQELNSIFLNSFFTLPNTNIVSPLLKVLLIYG